MHRPHSQRFPTFTLPHALLIMAVALALPIGAAQASASEHLDVTSKPLASSEHDWPTLVERRGDACMNAVEMMEVAYGAHPEVRHQLDALRLAWADKIRPNRNYGIKPVRTQDGFVDWEADWGDNGLLLQELFWGDIEGCGQDVRDLSLPNISGHTTVHLKMQDTLADYEVAGAFLKVNGQKLHRISPADLEQGVSFKLPGKNAAFEVEFLLYDLNAPSGWEPMTVIDRHSNWQRWAKKAQGGVHRVEINVSTRKLTPKEHAYNTYVPRLADIYKRVPRKDTVFTIKPPKTISYKTTTVNRKVTRTQSRAQLNFVSRSLQKVEASCSHGCELSDEEGTVAQCTVSCVREVRRIKRRINAHKPAPSN